MWHLVTILAVVSVAHGGQELGFKQDWWESALIYQIYTRSFLDTDGDGVGDIRGIISRLEYLKELNVDAICLSPIYKSPQIDFGFDVSDFYSVHSDYGSNEEFEELVREAQKLNIKVLLDFVPNHTSNESDWFQKAVGRDEYYFDWYVWAEGYLDNVGHRRPPNNWISMFKKSAWEFVPNRGQYYLHQFAKNQPDLNYRNPVVVDEMKNIIKFWLEKGVAGMKMSAVNHLLEVDKDSFGGRFPDEPKTGKVGLDGDDYKYLNHIYTKDLKESYDMVSQFREVFDSITLRDNMTRLLLTEASTTNIKNLVKYYGEGNNFGSQIPVNFALMEDFRKESDARDLKFVVDRWMTYKPANKPANWMSGNHDKARVASRLRPGLVDAFNMLVLLLPGVAMTYMGEEIGMPNGDVSWAQTKDQLACNTDDPINYVAVTRDGSRTPYQWNSERTAGFTKGHETWLPVGDSYETINAESQHSAAQSHYLVYRSLSLLRKRPAFRAGRFESQALTRDVFAFKRWYQDDTYVVVMNLGRSLNVVNLTTFDLVFGQLEVEASSALSSRSINDNVNANSLDLAADEALVLRMMV
ncbi:maltase 2-like [Leguminivora glycinivorella]|uniref:maltase 2-like n=1 Tax=Leguminivora glycinivorella TaxID=1035111 RepID=UPI00200D24A8|nr:maltase 2-like [Leguminivora glycinivorella]